MSYVLNYKPRLGLRHLRIMTPGGELYLRTSADKLRVVLHWHGGDKRPRFRAIDIERKDIAAIAAFLAEQPDDR
jgi:hypothetical protein